MKLLVASHNSRIDTGGKITQNLLMTELKERGHTIDFISTEDREGFKTHVVRDYMKLPIFEIREWLVKRQVERILEKEEYDFLYSDEYYFTPGALRAGLNKGVDTIAHFKDHWFADVTGKFVGDDGRWYDECNIKNIWKHNKLSRFPYNVYKLRYLKSRHSLLDRATIKIANSRSVKESLEDCNIEGATAVKEPVEIEEYQKGVGERFREKHGLEEDDKIVTFTGRLIKAKGSELLKQLIPHFKDRDDVYFYLTGSGRDKKELVEHFEEEGADNVVFTGWLERKDLIDLYDATDVVLYPNIFRGAFGMPAIEGGASGTPVISSRRDTVKDGETGYIEDPSKPDRWEKRLRELLEDEDLREEMGEEGKKEAEKYTVKKHADKVLEMLKEAK